MTGSSSIAPPELPETSDQILRAADLVRAPVIPSPLSQSTFDVVVDHIEQHHKGRTAILPVYTMVDRRRTLHEETFENKSVGLSFPMPARPSRWRASARRWKPLPRNRRVGQAFAKLWRSVERKTAKL